MHRRADDALQVVLRDVGRDARRDAPREGPGRETREPERKSTSELGDESRRWHGAHEISTQT